MLFAIETHLSLDVVATIVITAVCGVWVLNKSITKMKDELTEKIDTKIDEVKTMITDHTGPCDTERAVQAEKIHTQDKRLKRHSDLIQELGSQ